MYTRGEFELKLFWIAELLQTETENETDKNSFQFMQNSETETCSEFCRNYNVFFLEWSC